MLGELGLKNMRLAPMFERDDHIEFVRLRDVFDRLPVSPAICKEKISDTRGIDIENRQQSTQTVRSLLAYREGLLRAVGYLRHHNLVDNKRIGR